MRLEIVKYVYTIVRSKTYFILLFLFLKFISLPVSAQDIQFNFQDTPLSEALSEVIQKVGIRISFDADLLEKIRVTIQINETDPEAILSVLLRGTNFYFEEKYGTWLILKKAEQFNKAVQGYRLVSGIIFDEATGERLPSAGIYDRDHRLLISSNVEGSFSLRIPKATQEVYLEVSYLGYFMLDTLVQLGDENGLLHLGMKQKVHTIEQVNIAQSKIEMLDLGKEAGHVTFNPSRFVDLPNYGETDVFRALQLLPGVSSFENSSQLNIRGSSADQNLVLLDGFTLYNLDHFFGVFSALNPNVIKNIQVYRGGFDSRYGERVSAIVDIVGKSGNQSKPQIYGGVNLISANLTAEIPITKKLTVVAAARRAYTDMYSTWLADELLSDKMVQPRSPVPDANVITPEFYFSDFNLKLSYQLSDQENISFSSYGSKDYLNSSNSSSGERGDFNVDDINEWGNYGFGATWNKQWNPKYFTSLQLGHSGYYNDYRNTTTISQNNTEAPVDSAVIQDNEFTEVSNESNRLIDYFLTFRSEYTLNTDNQLEFGSAVKYNRFSFYKDASRDFVYDNLESSAFLYSAFVQDKIRLAQRFMLTPGLRLNYYSNSGKFYLEPRFTGSYLADNGLIFKLATGRYCQFLNKSGTEQNYGYNRDFWVLADGDVNPVISSNHFIAGVSFEKGDLYFDLEAYFKTVDGLQEYLFLTDRERRTHDAEPTSEFSRFVSGSGKARGIDFMTKYEGPNYTSWLAYSISKSTRHFDEINNGDEIPAIFDQTHELKWTNMYNVKRWNFSALTIYNTGKPYVESSTTDTEFNLTRVYNRLPDYFRVDLSANYNFYIKNVNIKPGLSVLNAFNTDNFLDAYTRVFDIGDSPQTETTLVKAQSLTFNFFVNFRF
ncbi:TonB-dependent receptor [Maribellus sediminis]|uniref:TonB-dependent receptor n=1 Tax=Maribellus sediminis TaxID=2696285 RepID=UPI00142F4DA0|nr:TonB-dependent receptor [Maribellus sediminis]